MHSPKGPAWANMGRTLIKGILNSARGLDPQDDSPQAQQARCIQSFSALNGIEFVAKVDIDHDQYGEAKNVIKTAITKTHQEYASLMGNASVPQQAFSTPQSQPVGAAAATATRPSWAQ